VNKTELIEHIAKQADISKAAASRALEAMIGGVKTSLKKNNTVSLVGFGTFSVDLTPPINASSARVAAALEMSACLAMCSISSDLFTKVPPLEECLEDLIWLGCDAWTVITAMGPMGVKRGGRKFYADSPLGHRIRAWCHPA